MSMAALEKIIAGDSENWSFQAPNHLEADGWALACKLRGPGNADVPVTTSNVADPSTRSIKLTSAISATLIPGHYVRTIVATKDGERQTLQQDNFEVMPDLSTSIDPYDGRSNARKALDAIEAVLANRATKAQEELSIAGRRTKWTPIPDLLVLRDKYASIVAMEDSAAGIGPRKNKIHTVWTR